MNVQAILDRLEELLVEERMAIRHLKGERVHAIACEKLELMTRLGREGNVQTAFLPRLKELVRRLKHNGVLLVHAKSIMSDALRIKRARLACVTGAELARPAARAVDDRFSVIG